MREMIFCYSPSYPKTCLSDYVYITSSANSNVWTSTGRRSDVIDILPRNSNHGHSQLSNSALSSINIFVDTKMSALRSMRLVLADEAGRTIRFGQRFMLRVQINYS